MEVASVLAVAEALEVASALLGAAVPPSNTPPPHPPAGRATGTEVLRLALGSTLSQAPCPAAWPSLQVPSFLCVLLLLVFEVELKLLSALISPLCPYLLHLSFHCSPSESHCVCPTPEQGNFPLLSTGPGISHLPSVGSSFAVAMKTQVTSSTMYRVCILAMFPLLFAHL